MVVDLIVIYLVLIGIDLFFEIVVVMIDEYFILFVVAVFVKGCLVICGIEEMCVKELDCIMVMVIVFSVCGVWVEELFDGLIVEGNGGDLLDGGVIVVIYFDYCIVMSMIVVGFVSWLFVIIDDMLLVVISYSGFEVSLCELGVV